MDLTFTFPCHILVSSLPRLSWTSLDTSFWRIFVAHPEMENSRRTTARPRFATFIHFCVASPFSTCLARGSARCLRLVSVFASRVRAHGNLGLAGVCARVGRPAAGDVIRFVRVIRVRVLTRSRAKRSLIKFITRSRPIITTLRRRYLFRRQDATRRESLSRRGGSFCEK